MANYKAISTGDWSNIAIWQTWNGSAWVAASVLPSSSDDVWSNNFTVTIDQDVTVLTLRNTSNASPSITAGGGFIVSGTGLTITCLSSVGIVQNNTISNALTISGSGTNTFNINILGVQGGSTFNCVTITSTGTINWVGSISSTANTSIGALRIDSNCVFNLIGDVYHNGAGSTTVCILFTSNSIGTTFNMVGNIGRISGGQTTAVFYILANITFNITGNILSSNILNNQTSILVQSGTNVLINVTGNVIGGDTSICILSASVLCYVTVIGQITAGLSAIPIVLNNANSALITTGPLICGPYGRLPFSGSRIFFINPSTTYFEFADNSQGGNPSGTVPNRFTLYTPDTIVDAPIAANVRQGTVYALGSQTGTLIVPDPSNVRKDVPTDNTVGTADLSAADMWDYLTSNISTSGSIGEAILDIKTKTDTIPTNPASVDAVGAIVASYNV